MIYLDDLTVRMMIQTEMEAESSNLTTTSTHQVHKQETLKERAEELFSEPANVVIVVLALTGLVANILTVAATTHIPGRQTTHSRLIISLSIADFCITLSVLLHFLVKVTSPLHEDEYCTEEAARSFLDFALLASLINLLAMGIDHYIAVLKPLHYHLIMSKTRANIMILAIWFISVLGGLLNVIVGSFLDSEVTGDFCYHVLTDGFEAQVPILCLVLLEMLILIYLYCHIFHIIKSSSYQIRLNARSLLRRQSANCNLHSRKAIITTLLIVGTFMVCWIPYSVYHLAGTILIHTQDRETLSKHQDTLILIHYILWILVQFNSLFDPLIYAVRTPVVQQGYKCMIKKLLKPFRSAERNIILTRTFSQRELARTYSSEIDINLAEDMELAVY